MIAVLLLAMLLGACTSHLDATTPTVHDTGYTTSSTAAPSVPALGSGITEAQIKELLARRAVYMQPEQWDVRDYQTFGDWAAARVYSDAFLNQDGEAGSGQVFQKKDRAWFHRDYVSLTDAEQAAVALTNMDAPREVWAYFGLQPGHVTPDVSHTTLPHDIPSDFAFVAEWGVERMNCLDTAAGTFTKDLVVGSPPTVTAQLRLSKAEMWQAYQGLRALDPWSYPRRFEPPYADVTDPGVEQGVSPVITYHLHLQAAGLEKDIRWSDDNGSSANKAKRLREFFHWLMTVVESKPEYKELPQARGGYV